MRRGMLLFSAHLSVLVREPACLWFVCRGVGVAAGRVMRSWSWGGY